MQLRNSQTNTQCSIESPQEHYKPRINVISRGRESFYGLNLRAGCALSISFSRAGRFECALTALSRQAFAAA